MVVPNHVSVADPGMIRFRACFSAPFTGLVFLTAPGLGPGIHCHPTTPLPVRGEGGRGWGDWFTATALLVCFSSPPPPFADARACSPKGSSSSQNTAKAYDDEYLQALAVADELCRCWRQKDYTMARSHQRLPSQAMHRDGALRRHRRLEQPAARGVSSRPRRAGYSRGAMNSSVVLPQILRPGRGPHRVLDARVIAAVDPDGKWRVAQFPIPSSNP